MSGIGKINNSMEIQVHEYYAENNESGDKVENFIISQTDGTIFHSFRWNAVVQQVFKTRLFYIMACQGNMIIACMPLHLMKKDRFSINAHSPPTSFEMPYGGILYSKTLDNEQRIRIEKEIYQKIVHWKKGISLIIVTQPGTISQARQYIVREKMCETAFVDLTRSLDEIWVGLDAKRRNMIRKAEKNGVTILAGGVELVDNYYDMINNLSQKTKIVLHPKEYYMEIVKQFHPRDEARVVLSRKEKEFLSGGIFLRYGNTGYYWHGASFSGSGNHGQNELIQWHVIQWLQRSGCSSYDLVRIDREKLRNIASFKLDFASHTVFYADYYCCTKINRLYRKLSYLSSPKEIIKRMKKT